MSGKEDTAAVVGLGAAACAVCCAGPILTFLAAIGLGTAAGVALLGVAALVIGAAAAATVLVRRLRRAAACAQIIPTSKPVELLPTRR